MRDVASLIVKQYLSLDPEVKKTLEDKEQMSRLSRVQWTELRRDLIALAGAAIPALIYLVLYFLGFSLPVS